MDNQQESSELAWLAGFFDGEGSLSVGVQYHKKGWVNLQTNVSVSNTCKDTAERVAAILKKHDIGVYFQKRKMRKGRRQLYQLHVTGHKRCKRFCDLMDGLLFTKARQLTLLRKYLTSRLERGKAPYSDEEIEWALEVRDLNQTRNGRSSETVRRDLLEARENLERQGHIDKLAV